MISRKIAEQTLAEALRTGGDFAELFVQDKKSSVLTLLDGRIDNAVTVGIARVSHYDLRVSRKRCGEVVAAV